MDELDFQQIANNLLKSQLTDAQSSLEKCEKELSILKAKNTDLKQKIRFLEGQIEAYQYCMNCRR